MLSIRELTARYGRIEALHGLSLEIGDNEIVALIGSNGAGKTTLLNSISRHVATAGELTYAGVDLQRKSAQATARLGVLHVPEGRHVFPGLTVEQNLAVGTVVWRGIRAAKIEGDLEKVYRLFPRLKERRRQLAWSLSGGEQQMLAVGRAMMGRPKLLMLDEPSMGLAPKVIDEMFEKILEINAGGTPVLLVEQNARLALEVSSRAYILDRGRITIAGKSSAMITDDRVREAYLGKSK